MSDVDTIDLSKAVMVAGNKTSNPDGVSDIDLSKATPYNPRALTQIGVHNRFISTESERASWNKPISLVEGAYRMFSDLAVSGAAGASVGLGKNIAEDEMSPGGKKGILTAAKETVDDVSLGYAGVAVGKGKLLPFSPTGAVQSLSVLKKVDALRKNEYADPSQRERDRESVQEYLLQQEEMSYRNYTVGGKIFKMAAESASFAAEFMLTGGFGAIAKKGAYKALQKAAGKATEQGAKRYAMKTAATVAGGAAQTVLMPHRIVANYGERQIFANATLTDKGTQILKEASETPIVSALKAIGDTAIENITENLGAFVFKPIAKAAGKMVDKLPSEFVKNTLRAYQAAFPDKKVGQVLRSVGWNGILTEMGEERLGDIFRATLGVEDFGTQGDNVFQNIIDSMPNGEDLLVEAGVFSIPFVANIATRRMRSQLESKGVPKDEIEDVLAGTSQSEKEAFVRDEAKDAEILAKAFEDSQAAEEKALADVRPEVIEINAEQELNPPKESELAAEYKKIDTERYKRMTESMPDKEQAGKMAKGAGFVRSAILRKMRGEPTGKEIQEAKKYLDSNYMGKIVETPEGAAQVAGLPAFGKVKVKLPSGEVKYVKSEDIKSTTATKEDAIEHLKREAEKTARLEISIFGNRPKEKATEPSKAAEPEFKGTVDAEKYGESIAGDATKIEALKKQEAEFTEKIKAVKGVKGKEQEGMDLAVKRQLIRESLAKTNQKAEEKTKEEKPTQKPAKVRGKFVSDGEGGEVFEGVDIKTSKLGKGVQEKAVAEDLTTGFDDLQEYEAVNMKDQARKAEAVLEKDPAEAVKIALGKKRAPKGVLPEAVFIAVENKALAEKDVDLLQSLATESKLVTEATKMGQRIRTLGERNPHSAVAAIQRANNILESNFEMENTESLEKAKKAEVKEIKTEIEKKKPKAKDWAAFIDSIRCK